MILLPRLTLRPTASESATSAPSKTRVGAIIRCLAVATVAFVTSTATLRAVAEKPAEDPILRAMQQELDREKAGLILPGMQRPYFIEYRLDDVTTYEAVANYGALTSEQEGHQRVVRVNVRIGSYTLDNSSARGDGTVQLAPTDNNPQAIRYALWLATDDAYKLALRGFAAKQANLKRFESQVQEPDFAEAKPLTRIDPLVSLDLDRKEWKRRLTEASALYASAPEVRDFARDVQYSTTNIRAAAVNRYLVNTEGTVVRHGYTGYQDNVSVGGQAADGMRLGRDNGSIATSASELESAASLHQRTIDDLLSFNNLRNAPVVSAEDYHGPVLFSGDASADILARLFTPNVEADRPEMGTSARTQGVYTSSYHSRVLPAFLDATDDPTLTTFNHHDLVGSYSVDDEGVPAQPVKVAVHGILQNYLIGRTPVKDFPSSNGHGRAPLAQPAHAHSGVMLFTSAEPVPARDLITRILTMAREQDRDFIFAVDTLGADLAPRLLFRVKRDGSRELVRGAVFDELDQRSLRSDVIAAGDDPFVFNSLGAVPQTTIAPSLLFGDIAVKRATQEQEKLPYYPPPALTK